MTEPSAAARVWRSRLLGYLDGHAADMVADLAGLAQVPSISGTAEENAIQGVLSARLAGDGLDVDAWHGGEPGHVVLATRTGDRSRLVAAFRKSARDCLTGSGPMAAP